MKPDLTVESLCSEARAFAAQESTYAEPSLYGVTDGKAVGTYFEHKFQAYLHERYNYVEGSSARGFDFPELGVNFTTGHFLPSKFPQGKRQESRSLQSKGDQEAATPSGINFHHSDHHDGASSSSRLAHRGSQERPSQWRRSRLPSTNVRVVPGQRGAIGADGSHGVFGPRQRSRSGIVWHTSDTPPQPSPDG